MAEDLAAFLILALVLCWYARNPPAAVTALRTAEHLEERRAVAAMGRDSGSDRGGVDADRGACRCGVPPVAAVDAPEPLTPIDEQLLDTVAVCMPAYHQAAIDRGRQLADLFRSRAPGSSDAELSRGVLHVTHVLEWAGQQLGDPGFYGHVATELAVCAYELTELERSEVTDAV
jgi:hypothetical protein